MQITLFSEYFLLLSSPRHADFQAASAPRCRPAAKIPCRQRRDIRPSCLCLSLSRPSSGGRAGYAVFSSSRATLSRRFPAPAPRPSPRVDRAEQSFKTRYQLVGFLREYKLRSDAQSKRQKEQNQGCCKAFHIFFSFSTITAFLSRSTVIISTSSTASPLALSRRFNSLSFILQSS